MLEREEESFRNMPIALPGFLLPLPEKPTIQKTWQPSLSMNRCGLLSVSKDQCLAFQKSSDIAHSAGRTGLKLLVSQSTNQAIFVLLKKAVLDLQTQVVILFFNNLVIPSTLSHIADFRLSLMGQSILSHHAKFGCIGLALLALIALLVIT